MRVTPPARSSRHVGSKGVEMSLITQKSSNASICAATRGLQWQHSIIPKYI